MIILLSPAKTLDFESPVADETTAPKFARTASALAKAASAMSANELSELMHISDDLAVLNRKRFRGFGRAPKKPAIRAFAGDVYRGFDAASADEATLEFAQDHVRVLSGLYGILRPLDAIRPYRLEMGTRWSPEGDKLTEHWGDRVAKELSKTLRAEGSQIVINLASNEYFAVVKGQLAKKVQVIAPDFRVRTAKGLQFQSFVAKVARGAMARWVCDERIEDPSALSDFDRDGWRFDPDGSSPDAPLFTRG